MKEPEDTVPTQSPNKGVKDGRMNWDGHPTAVVIYVRRSENLTVGRCKFGTIQTLRREGNTRVRQTVGQRYHTDLDSITPVHYPDQR